MNENEARTIYVSLSAELADAEEKARLFASRGSAIRKMLEGLIELFPEVGVAPQKATVVAPPWMTPTTPRASTGRDVLRQVMENEGRWMSAGEIVEVIEQMGVDIGSDHPEHTVRRWLREAFGVKMVDRRKRDGRTLEFHWLTDGEAQAVDGLFLDDDEEASG